jgi:hypothetical protein
VANILVNIQIWNLRQIRRKWYDWPGEILKNWGLTNSYKCLQIYYECPCKCPCECLRTPYEWNDYTTHAWRIAYTPIANVSLCHLFAIYRRVNFFFTSSSWIRKSNFKFVKKSRRMLANPYKCLTIPNNALSSLQMLCHQ